MNLKQRFSINFSVLFSVLLAIVLLIIFTLYSKFRQEEFHDRLQEKAETTIRLLMDVKEIDYQVLKIVDRNTINKLYNEKVLVFGDSLNLIYSSIDDAVLQWSETDLERIQKNGSFFRAGTDSDVFGMFYNGNGRKYYCLVTAEDKYGNRKLNYLKYLLLAAFAFGSSLVWILSLYVSKKGLQPLDEVKKKIQDITARNLNARLAVTEKKDEITDLAKSFNQMMDRIDGAYNRQKEFTANASHELRTPVARIVSQIENMLKNGRIPPEAHHTLESISEDTYQLSDVITSLLLLSRMEERSESIPFSRVRLDEILFSSAAQVQKIYPAFKLHFDIENSSGRDTDMEIPGDETLLRIAFGNLLKNACLYSESQHASCLVNQSSLGIEVIIDNRGDTPDVSDTRQLFNAFMRGSNSMNKRGTGLGLRIVERILNYHNARIEYTIPEKKLNRISVFFSTHTKV